MKTLTDLLSDLIATPKSSFAPRKPALPSKFAPSWFPTVHSDDLEPVFVIEPSEKGPWIAGGAVLKWYQGQPVGGSDIDVFCTNSTQASAIIANLKRHGETYVRADTENALTLDYTSLSTKKTWTVQVIKKHYFTNPQDLINKFDITVCQVATNGQSYILGQTTAHDIRTHTLRMIFPLQTEALRRFIKYQAYGYKPVPGLLASILDATTTNWEIQESGDYNGI